MSRPRLLDLGCGEGGAAVGYHRAGFDVVGVDITPQPRYPFDFVQADALKLDVSLTPFLDGDRFDAVHASPVCKLYSPATPAWARANHPNQIPAYRTLLKAIGLPWVMENVPGAPLRPDLKLCGCVVGLGELERERWFELWRPGVIFDLRQPCHHPQSPITVAGHGEPSGPRMAHGLIAHKADWERAMGIDWMTRDGLAQAVPPAYTEYIGRALIDVLAVTA